MSSLDLGKNLKNKDAIKNLLGSVNNADKREVNIELLVSYRKHPFKLYEDERLDDMIGSIKQVGILSPVIVREIEDGKLEILAGHNRVNAAKLSGLKTVPIVIMKVDDDIADRIVVESNFVQRSEFLPSEKAKAYKLLLDSLNRQGKKIIKLGDTYGEIKTPKGIEKQEDSREIVAKYYKTSPAQIQRYVRLNYLTEGLLNLVDKNQLALRPAVEVSYLDKKAQNSVECFINMGNKLSLKHATSLREKAESIGLTTNDIANLLPEKKEKIRKIEVPFSEIKELFAEEVTDEEIIKIIINSMKHYTS